MKYCELTDKNDGKPGPDNPPTIYPKSRFCTKYQKGLDFQGFWAFLSRSHGRLKKKTVNSRLKNANLCLRFGWVHFILINHFCGDCLFFDYRDAIIEWRVVQCRGRGPWGHNRIRHYGVGSKFHPRYF